MSSTNKRAVLLIVFLAILGGLYVLITQVGLPGGAVQTPSPKLPQLTSANIQAHWTEIAAQVAAPPRGDPQAPYTVVEVGDFQCPQCGKMRPVIERMVAQSGGRVNMLFLQRPLPNLHKWALAAAAASLAAAAQGKFWPMYDALYSQQDDLEPGYYNGYAAKAGLNVPQFSSAMASHQYLPTVEQDIQLDDSLQLEVTPTLLVRDNKTGKVTIYIGSDSSLPGSIVGFQGIKQLLASPPWGSSAVASATHHS